MATNTWTHPAGPTAGNHSVRLRATGLVSFLFLLILAGCGDADPAAEATTTTASPTTIVVSTTTADVPHPGQETYESACAVCHDGGAAGAPKFGDHPDDAWPARIAQGVDVLYDHALNGFEGADGMMPAKGGRRFLDDESVKAAVDYLIENSK